MQTRIEALIRANPETVYELAAGVEAWPRLLPHYRWVRVLAQNGPNQRTVEMAARRDVLAKLGVPLHWVAIQTLHPSQHRIEFEHIRGITRGMRVAWEIEPVGTNTQSEQVRVRISHWFEPSWPVPRAAVQAIVGEYFVNGVARRTLARIAQASENTHLTAS